VTPHPRPEWPPERAKRLISVIDELDRVISGSRRVLYRGNGLLMTGEARISPDFVYFGRN
jgi:hypothetical protein